MKLKLLKEALQHYVLSADCSDDDREQVFEAIDECTELDERVLYRELWKDEVYIVSIDSLLGLLNAATYDDYGRLARKLGHDVPFKCYADAIREWNFTELTNRAVQLGYDLICDLWRDNEAYGSNNSDGTFNRGFGSLTSEDVSIICDILKSQLDGIQDGPLYHRVWSIVGKFEGQ